LSLEKEKLNLKRQSTDITHSLQCVLEFQSDHAQWRSKWGHAPQSVGLGGASTHFIQTFKKRVFH